MLTRFQEDSFFEMAAKVLSGTASNSDIRQFNGLLLENDALMHRFMQLKSQWERAASLGDFDKIDVNHDWEMLTRRVHNMGLSLQESNASTSIRNRLLRFLPHAAAVLLLIVLSGVLLMEWQQDLELAKQVTLVEAPAGSRIVLLLPDGSRVRLNANSTLRYTGHFNRRNRHVELSGEAFFDVETSNVPFVVMTHDLRFRVLGTSFNIKAYDDEKTIEASLLSGLLRVDGDDAVYGKIEPILLEPNQKAVFFKNSGSLMVDELHEEKIPEKRIVAPVKAPSVSRVEIRRKQDFSAEVGWTDGVLVFESEPLSELTRKLERKYDVQFVFENAELKDYRYTGSLRDLTLEQVMEAMKLTSPIDFTIHDKTVSIRSSR
jgi:ferric-dicitrate binding protein FerR (iron transport regulator)